ncbi:tRNA (N(6)-L-threonylcarbamoyladenosine(37)-C(2))-methylthiotransferase, partial [Candidatus Micrarchaeota archaeon]|nr:tRNA (N(6)-L-threonylcarbamoyladenosine(37)-C(2))-methylthiotransferase [Candidatus Micrarchaeota archaeon]
MKIFLDSYGCTLNQADASIIRGILRKHKFVSLNEADAVIVNSCGVKLTTEDKILSAIERYKSLGKLVIVAGCLPRINPKRMAALNIVLVDSNSLERLPDALKAKRGTFFSSEKHANKIQLAHEQDDSPTAVVEISEGCLGACAFCGTKNARGHLTSYSKRDVVNYARSLIRSGKKEILITSQDTGAYGVDIGSSLPELINGVTSIPGDFLVRVGMTNPNFVLTDLKEFKKMYENEKVYKFAHIPIQSGSDRILRLMNRVGTARDFEKIVKELRKIPDITIATDIIVGFSGETDADFAKTVALIKKTKPEIVNVSRFTPRPGTRASFMKQMPSETSKRRSLALSRVCRKITTSSLKKYVGVKMRVLVTGKAKDGKTLARAPNYRQVILDR